MAVTLPSDLVMDVLRNADPVRHSGAVARLQSPGTRFEAVVDGTASTTPGRNGGTSWGSGSLTAAPGSRDQQNAKAGPYHGFERMVLRNLFESLLPDAESGSFGTGPSAGVWRSLAADQLAGVYADAGGIGLAKMMSARAEGSLPSRDSQWPYFSLGRIGSFSGDDEAS